MIENKNCVADIGTDHGILCKILLENKCTKKVIATDISKKCLEKAIDLAKKFDYNFPDRFEAREGDGFEPLEKDEVDLAVVAGMGGQEIIKFLKFQDLKNIQEFIFAPAQNVAELREYLSLNEFEIVKDEVVKDQNKFYHTLYVKKSTGKCLLSKTQILFGKFCECERSKDFEEFLNDFIRRQKLILKAKNKLELAMKVKESKICKEK